jgi:hypothetical protein
MRQHAMARPNPSFERTRYGMASWPRSAAAHRALRGQGATLRSTPTLGVVIPL